MEASFKQVIRWKLAWTFEGVWVAFRRIPCTALNPSSQMERSWRFPFENDEPVSNADFASRQSFMNRDHFIRTTSGTLRGIRNNRNHFRISSNTSLTCFLIFSISVQKYLKPKSSLFSRWNFPAREGITKNEYVLMADCESLNIYALKKTWNLSISFIFMAVPSYFLFHSFKKS